MLKDKTILIMGIRNKWSIAYGVAKSAYRNGAKLVFTYMGKENKEKIEALISEFEGARAYECDVSIEAELANTLGEIKKEYPKLDGVLHAIAHANTEDLRNDFIDTSKDGFTHANDVSAYTLISIARTLKELEMLNEKASIVCLTYYGAEKVLPGYNVMGVAKAALECSVRYLADNLGKDGMRINAISAGPIKTLSAKGIKDFDSMLDVVAKKAALKRNVTADEVGNLATFLFSDMSSAITGQTIYADCGYAIMGM